MASVESQKETDNESVVDQSETRQSWGGQLEFILTCVGFAVGLGNVWRFPYLAYANGGGAFLIPYVLMLLFIGLPMFFLEVSFGQFASLGPIPIWKINPLMKGIGFASVVVAAIIVLYYNVIVAWCLYYFFASMTDVLPWTSCDNWWNTENCLESGGNVTLINGSLPDNLKTSSEEYYYNNVLQMSDGLDESGKIVWQLALCLLLAWVIIFMVLIKGIGSLGKASYFVSLFPYVLLTIMLIRGVTLPGSAKGIEFYVTPDWDKLASLQTWSDAATQIFYSLGISMGSLIAMASFNPFNNNIQRDAMLIPFINCGTSIYAGFVIFSVLGYMADEKGVDVSEVAAEGPGLVFVVYPEGLATMPIAPLWSVLFFFMMTMLGFSSQFSTAEGVIAAFMDEYPQHLRRGYRPMIMRGILCFTFFLLGLPMVTQGGFYLFTLVNDYSGGYPLLSIALLELITIVWVYGYAKYSEDIQMMIGSKPGIYWKACWLFITPAVILMAFGTKIASESNPPTLGDYVYPPLGTAVAWLVAIFPIFVIVVYFIGAYCMSGGWKILIEAGQPSPKWGPYSKANREGRYMHEDIHAKMVEEQAIQKEPQPYQVFNKSENSRTDTSVISSGGSSSSFPLYSTVDTSKSKPNGNITQSYGNVNEGFVGQVDNSYM